MKEEARNPIQEYRLVNVDATLKLANHAAAAGVRRFIFVSSVKVNGEFTVAGQLFRENDEPAPMDPYGISKMEAERGLLQIAAETGMEVVIIRPPLVYGPGVKANFAALIRAVQRGWVMPLGAVNNQRSLVALANLVDFIIHCTTHPLAANQTFLVSDGMDVSTTALIRSVAHAAERPARLLSVPLPILQMLGRFFGRANAVARLCSNLQIDISKARNILNWSPLVTLDEGLRQCIAVESTSYMQRIAKRMFDVALAVAATILFFLPLLLVGIAVALTSKGSILYWSDRVGIHSHIFKMPKFRSMQMSVPVLATHLLPDPKIHLTVIGEFLRKSSLDELPQLWSILKGDMSFVGPRPALFNQYDLIALRAVEGVDQLIPGLTGWAQANGRDELSIEDKVALDVFYLKNQSLWLDIKILWMTFIKVVRREGVSH
jgi:lipopolysaccharide/colanic/teichoic acid biosynthesis glycosyltransferase/dTDP-4-dehydrorhamnose reductase